MGVGSPVGAGLFRSAGHPPSVVATALAWAIAGMGLVGLLIAIYFTLVTYRVVPPDTPWVPALCRMEEDSCFTVLDSEHARVFGVPNCVLGLGWYGAATVGGLVGAWTGTVPFLELLTLVGVVTVAVSVYLAYALLAILETHCRLCYTSHLLNTALTIALASILL